MEMQAQLTENLKNIQANEQSQLEDLETARQLVQQLLVDYQEQLKRVQSVKEDYQQSQAAMFDMMDDVKNKKKELIDEFIQKRSHNYYVDSSIITMNSPEIDFNNNYKSGTFEDLNLRIVGYVPLTSNNSDSYIDLKGTPMNV